MPRRAPRRTNPSGPSRRLSNMTSALRRTHLTSPLTWFLLRKRNSDPPARQEDPIWQRVIRLEFATTTANQVITHKQISDSDTLGIFRYMSIERIDVYADAPGRLYVVSYIPDPSGTSVRIDRTFKDEGIAGATRANVSIVLPPQMRYPMHHGTTNALGLINVHTNVVIDFHVKLWRGPTIPAALLPSNRSFFAQQLVMPDEGDHSIPFPYGSEEWSESSSVILE